MRPHDGRIDEKFPELFIVDALQPLPESFPQLALFPTAEAVIDGIPVAELTGQVAPMESRCGLDTGRYGRKQGDVEIARFLGSEHQRNAVLSTLLRHRGNELQPGGAMCFVNLLINRHRSRQRPVPETPQTTYRRMNARVTACLCATFCYNP